jgi:hypothetical protein
MPLVTTPTTVTPNAVFPQVIQFSTRIIDGIPRISAAITLCAAAVTNPGESNESWQKANIQRTLNIPDMRNLPSDLASLQTRANAAIIEIMSIIASANAIREIL